MRAIILALDRCTEEDSRRLAPPFMLPLVDRPFLQHVVERLIDGGVTEFDMVLDARTRDVAVHFGNGQRWGSSIRYHSVPDAHYPFSCLESLGHIAFDEPLVLATGDALPEFKRDELTRLAEMARPHFYSHRETRSAHTWSGWALIDGGFLASLPEYAGMETVSHLLNQSGEIRLVSKLLHAGSYAELLKAQQGIVTEKISRSARVHPTATITGPVFIGDHARIERGARIGPNVVIGANSVIGADTRIQNSLICPKTYVGDSLEINHLILDGTELFHAALSASVTISEPIFLSRLAR